ncbi:MAG: DNA repair protein RecN [SAR202 cluster bacterium]|nr:DNA repair protein RecN [SAR202 cluster bacterium]
MAIMLAELSVRNFAVIQETRLSLGPGFNVVTGETGAGKSLLVDALVAVLGGRADRDLIRSDANAAYVEAVFHLPIDGGDWPEALAEHGVEIGADGVLVLSRDIAREGRTTSRVNGRAVPLHAIKAIGSRLVDIHGQSAHLSLLEPSFQLALLDASAGLQPQRAEVAAVVAEARRIEQAIASIATNDRLAEQRRDLLANQINEINSAKLTLGEEDELLRARDVLANARAIQEACAGAYRVLYEGGRNASDLIANALRTLRHAPDPTGALAPRIAVLEAALIQVQDAAREIRSFGESIEQDPRGLDEIEDRLQFLKRLKRKYGDSVPAMLAFAANAQRELESLDTSAERRSELERQLQRAVDEAGRLAWSLAEARGKAAAALESAVASELADVGLGRVRFAVSLARRPSAQGIPGADGQRYAFTASGIDQVEFLVATNPGEALKPLGRVASGGETSRLMLAIKSALRASNGVPTLVFDEVDSGIGGRAGEAVGRKMARLGRHSQVLCVTHLPQIAAFADGHFRVDKAVLEERTFAQVEMLGAEERVRELALMLAGHDTPDLREAARQMLERARAPSATSASGRRDGKR